MYGICHSKDYIDIHLYNYYDNSRDLARLHHTSSASYADRGVLARGTGCRGKPTRALGWKGAPRVLASGAK